MPIVKALSVAQMREVDRRCIEELGIPGVVLMNSAGQAVFSEVHEGPVGIVCGKGNNGGDGFVVARLALDAGMETRVVLIADRAAITGDAAVFMSAFERLGGVVETVQEPAAIAEALRGLAHCAVLIDAMLGTGVQGTVRGPLRDAIEHWPGVPTIAVDVPSGLDADTGEVCGCCVCAQTTVTLQFPKIGFDNPQAAQYLGRLVVADIGIPEVCADDEAWRKLKST